MLDFIAGSRTKEHIGKIIDSLKRLNPKGIFTDKLNVYPGLIDRSIHIASAYRINHIERFNFENAFEKAQQENNLLFKE